MQNPQVIHFPFSYPDKKKEGSRRGKKKQQKDWGS